MKAIFKREFRSYFTSPLGYVFIFAFLLLSAIIFTIFNLMQPNSDMTSFFSVLTIIFIVLIPILTMKSFSEEKKTKTDQLLLTSPVSLASIVGGKFFAAFCVYAVALLSTFIFVIIIAAYGKPDYVYIIGNYFGLLFIGATLIAIGVFVSSLTENQVISAIITFAIILTFFLLDMVLSIFSNSVLSAILSFVSVFIRYQPFTIGVLSITSVLYYISMIFIFLFLTVRSLDKKRWS